MHQRLYERTGGRLGHALIGVPTALLRYARDGGDYLLVASNGGSDRPPGWLFNIDAEPKVEFQDGRYGRYQARTGRKIPVAVVTPGD